LLGLVVFAGCGDGGERRAPQIDLDAFRSAQGPPIYWLGPSFDGYRLTYGDVNHRPGPVLLYGDCTPKRPKGLLNPDGGSCELPIQLYHLAVTLGRLKLGIPCVERRLRDVPALLGDGILLYTGRTILRVRGPTRAHELRIVQALRPINAGGRARTPLPAPPAWVERGLECR